MTATDTVAPSALPRTDTGKMAKVIIAFDVDGTLIKNAEVERYPGVFVKEDVPIIRQINTLKTLSTYKNVKIVVWSGGGKDYATQWGRRLKIDKYVWQYASKLDHQLIKQSCELLIAVDDIQATALGDVNLIVREK